MFKNVDIEEKKRPEIPLEQILNFPPKHRQADMLFEWQKLAGAVKALSSGKSGSGDENRMERRRRWDF